MRKIYLMSFFIFCLSADLYAQQDSVRNVLQQKQMYFSDSVAISVYNFAKGSPLFINELIPKQISRITIGHQLEQGKFIAAQGSTKTNIAFLSSEGTTVLNGIKLYGSFYYNKVFEDSTRFATQSRNNLSTPYYFGSPTNNHYERSIYDFKVMGAKNILSDKITAGLGFDYHIADHFATNDPRGSLKEYQLNVKATLSYNFNTNLRFGLGYNIGYGQETVVIGYKNRAYYESLEYPNYINYLVNGYGEPKPFTSKRNYNDFQNRSGFEVIMILSNTSFGSFYLKGSQIDEQQDYDYRNDVGITKLANYDLSKNNVDLLWKRELNKGTFSASLDYKHLSGKDFNLEFQATNYLFTSNQFNLQLNYSIAKDKIRYNYLIGVNQIAEERLDGITGNKVYFKNLGLNAGFGLIRQLNRHRSIGANLGAHYGFSIVNDLAVNRANESYFTRGVILHDYLYNTSSKMGGSLGVDYSFPFFKVMQNVVKLNLVYTAKNEMKAINRNLTTIPGNDRFFSNLSFNLYF